MRLRTFAAHALAAPALAPFILALACARPPKAELDAKRTLDALRTAQVDLPKGNLTTALTEVAWQRHPALAQAKSELEAAKAGITTAKTRPNPSFGFSATKAAGSPQPWTLTYGLTFPLELGGKRKARVRLAQIGVEQAELQVADTAWKLRSGIRSALVDWEQARETARTADREADLRKQLLAWQDRRLALGEIGSPEHATSVLDYQQAEYARLVAHAELDRAASALARAVGLPLPAIQARLDAEPGPTFDLPSPPVPGDVEALIHRLDVRQVLLDWDHNEATLDQELAQRVPNLQVGPGYSLDQGVKKWTLGFSVDLPIFDRRQGPIAEAVARRGVIEAHLRQVETQALSEAALADQRLVSARARLVAQTQALDAQRSRLESAQRLYDLGGADQGAYLAAELEASQARSLAVDAWAEVQRARLAVEDAYQKPLDPAEQPYPLEGTRP